MLLEIKPLDMFDWDCFTGHIVSVASFWQCNYFLALSDSWSFPKHDIASSAKSYNLIGNSYIKIDKVLKYSDFTINFLEDIQITKSLNIIFNELSNNRPVLIKHDPFWCPWFDNCYQKIHNEHCFLIIGFDSSDNTFYCTDVSFKEYKSKISVDNIKKGFLRALVTFSREKNIILPTKCDYLFSIKSAAERMLGVSDAINKFNYINNFADNLSDLYDLSIKEAEGYVDKNIIATKLFREIRYIISGRFYFSKLIRFIGEEYNDNFMKVYSNAEVIIREWINISFLMIKAHEMNINKSLLTRITGLIKDVSKLEEALAKEILIIAKE